MASSSDLKGVSPLDRYSCKIGYLFISVPEKYDVLVLRILITLVNIPKGCHAESSSVGTFATMIHFMCYHTVIGVTFPPKSKFGQESYTPCYADTV